MIRAIETYNECFSYDQASGALSWKERPLSHFVSEEARNAWNKKMVGHVVMPSPGHKYIRMHVFRKKNLAHRVIWEMVNGPIPHGMYIDHIDGNRLNNRMSNLRLATKSQNGANRPAPANSSSGIKGVYFKKKIKRWVSSIWKDGGNVHLGCFATKGEAAVCRAKASIRFHGQYANFQ